MNIILCSSKVPIWNHNVMSCLFFTFRKVLVIQMTPLLTMDIASENGMSPQQNMERYSLNILLVFFWNNLVRQTHKSFWNILWPCYYCMFIEYLMAIAWSLVVNYLIQMCDQDRISPYNINTIWGRQVMRIKKISLRGLLVDSIPNSLNQHHQNCMADSKENYL